MDKFEGKISCLNEQYLFCICIPNTLNMPWAKLQICNKTIHGHCKFYVSVKFEQTGFNCAM